MSSKSANSNSSSMHLLQTEFEKEGLKSINQSKVQLADDEHNEGGKLSSSISGKLNTPPEFNIRVSNLPRNNSI